MTTTLSPDPDYSQFLFEPERMNAHSNCQTELAWLTTRNKTERTISCANLSVQTDGSIAIGGTTYRTTKWAFEQFCNRLGIPRPFARKIPPDLLLSNITRLIQEQATNSTLLQFHFITSNNIEVLCGCTKEDYRFVDAADCLTAIAAMDGNGYSLSDLYVGDRMIDADLLLDQVDVTTPTSQQKFSVGVNIRSSDIGDVNPSARLILKDDSTGFSCVLSTAWGRVDRIRNKKVSIQTSFINFMGKVREMIIPCTQLEVALEKNVEEFVTDTVLKNWFDTFNRTIDNKDAIDDMLGWTEESRKDTWKAIANRRKNNALNRLQGLSVQPDLISDYQGIVLTRLAAEYASNAVFDEREPIRRLAGSLIDLP